mmetsp:Transcript_16757/g.23306  ORF Transcript_16757/g.23306 Transcript_16757/m.23306 type:complete len:188 (+) Transcript_16757:22-585(+)
MADNELQKKFAQRQNSDGSSIANQKPFNPYNEFPDFTRKEIKNYETMFKKYDTSKDGFIDLMELKYMMEKLGHPQTHVSLKEMIKEVDEDFDGVVSFREFLLIFRKAAKGELVSSGLSQLVTASSVDVDKEGVGGAKNFFEAKAAQQGQASKNEQEIKAEQEERKKQQEEAKKRKEAFKAKAATFQQ